MQTRTCRPGRWMDARMGRDASGGGPRGRARTVRHPSRTVQLRTSTVGQALDNPTAGLSEPATDVDKMMEDMKAFLQVDLENLFNERGIDKSKYQEEMEFEDPITSYSTLSGYLLNIQMLRYVFNPQFQLHSVERTGKFELTTRWTMKMEFFGKFLPSQVWRPEMAWTGVSIMEVNPETGKFCKHVDKWDSIETILTSALKVCKICCGKSHRSTKLQTWKLPPIRYCDVSATMKSGCTSLSSLPKPQLPIKGPRERHS